VAVAVQLAFVLAGYVCRENGYFRGGYYLPWVYLYRRDQSMIGRERCVGGALLNPIIILLNPIIIRTNSWIVRS